jgi:hypothetical protein
VRLGSRGYAIKFKCTRRRYAKAAFDQSGADTLERALCLVSYFAACDTEQRVLSFEVCIRPPQTVELARYVCRRRHRRRERERRAVGSRLFMPPRSLAQRTHIHTHQSGYSKVAKVCSAHSCYAARVCPCIESLLHLHNLIFPPRSRAFAPALCRAQKRSHFPQIAALTPENALLVCEVWRSGTCNIKTYRNEK